MFLQRKNSTPRKEKALIAFNFVTSMSASYFAVKLFETHASTAILSASNKEPVNELLLASASISVMITSYLVSFVVIGICLKECFDMRRSGNSTPVNLSEVNTNEGCPYGEGPYDSASWKSGGMVIGGDDSYGLFPIDSSVIPLSPSI